VQKGRLHWLLAHSSKDPARLSLRAELSWIASP
jgi:hypothetical protein